MTPTLKTIFAAADEAGLTGVEIAAICGVHFTTVSRWRNGAKPPTLASLEPLIKRLGLRLRAK